jgi:hypothetical protein
MPQTPGDRRGPAGQPAEGARVEITVIPGPRSPTMIERIGAGRSRRLTGLLIAATFAAGALAAGVSLAGRGAASAPRRLPRTVLPTTVLYPTYLRYTGPMDLRRAPVVAFSTYPVRCLSLLIALHDPSVMNAAFDRNLPCGHPRGPNTMIAIRGPQSGAARSAPPGARSRRG